MHTKKLTTEMIREQMERNLQPPRMSGVLQRVENEIRCTIPSANPVWVFLDSNYLTIKLWAQGRCYGLRGAWRHE